MSDELSAYAAKRKSKAMWRNLVLALLLTALLAVAAFLLTKYYFIVRQVQIQQTSLYSNEALLECVGVSPGTPMHAVSKKDVISAIEENFPYLVNVKVNRKLPTTLEITFDEAFGELAVTLGDELFAVDRSLQVLAKESVSSTIPRIRIISYDISRCIVGEKMSFFDEAGQNMMLELVSALEKEGMLADVKSIDIRDKFNIRLTYTDRFEIQLGDNSELKYKFAMVKEVLRDLDPNATGSIDITDPNVAYVNLDDTATISNEIR